MTKNSLIFMAVLIVALLASFPAHAIKKCKDDKGKWHYGDRAVRSCEKSKVTTLNDRGFVESVKSAPKSKEELKAEEDRVVAAELEAKRVKREDDERIRILGIYETEADIDRQKDNQIDSIESNIAVHKSYLNSMTAKVARTKKSLQGTSGVRKKNLEESLAESNGHIEEYTGRLEDLIKEKQRIVKKFETEKEIYRSLKNSSD